MSHRFSFFFLAIFSFLLVSVSCKDKTKKPYCTENPGNCQSVLAAKNFFLFKEGSWWVYEEETTHERDSMYVTEYTNTSGYDFDMRVKSALTDYEYHYWPVFAGGSSSCDEVNPVQGKCVRVKRSKGKPNDYIGESYCFFVNYKLGGWIVNTGNVYFDNNILSINQLIPTFEVDDLQFGETVKIHELSTVEEGVQPTNHYYSVGVGLIRKELLDSNQVWNLISYHIEP